MITTSYGHLDNGPDAVIIAIGEKTFIPSPKLSRLINLLPVISLDRVLDDLLYTKLSSNFFFSSEGL